MPYQCCIGLTSHWNMNIKIPLVVNITVVALLLAIFSSTTLYCNAQLINLEGLKDAVLSAEGTIGDIFQSLDSVAKHLKFSKEALQDTVEEECTYSCPNGSSPKKNKYHKPTSNGCGPLGMEIDTSQLPMKDITRCCDEHDICYGTCNIDKDKCDFDFKKCLYKLCDSYKIKASEAMSTGCKTAAKMLYTGTTVFGCKFYKLAQAEACYCPPSRKFSGDEF